MERPPVQIGISPSAARPRLDMMPASWAFIPSPGWVELTGGGDLRDSSAISNTNAGRSLPLGQALRCP